MADVFVPWAAGYSGWLGVVMSGRQPGSSMVLGLPSSNPGTGPKPSAVTEAGSIAVTGRQKRNRYLALSADIRASALTALTMATSRAVCSWSSERAVARSRAAMLNCRITFAV